MLSMETERERERAQTVNTDGGRAKCATVVCCEAESLEYVGGSGICNGHLPILRPPVESSALPLACLSQAVPTRVQRQSQTSGATLVKAMKERGVPEVCGPIHRLWPTKGKSYCFFQQIRGLAKEMVIMSRFALRFFVWLKKMVFSRTVSWQRRWLSSSDLPCIFFVWLHEDVFFQTIWRATRS